MKLLSCASQIFVWKHTPKDRVQRVPVTCETFCVQSRGVPGFLNVHSTTPSALSYNFKYIWQ